MADYGPPESVSTEGWAILLAFGGVSLVSGGLAYGAGALQILLTAVGVVTFIFAIALGVRIKPKKAGAVPAPRKGPS